MRFVSDLRKYRREVEDVDGIFTNATCEAPQHVDAVTLGAVISAIAKLLERQCRPLVMMEAFGFSQRETAWACGCIGGTIKSRRGKGRSALGHAIATEQTSKPQSLPHQQATGPEIYCAASV